MFLSILWAVLSGVLIALNIAGVFTFSWWVVAGIVLAWPLTVILFWLVLFTMVYWTKI